jgi:DNA-binding HxlR family transcriptional regulator
MPIRVLLDKIADKWSVLILAARCHGPLRFNELKRRLDGISQRRWRLALKTLDKNGIVSRKVLAQSPIAVEYEITKPGRTLEAPFAALHAWADPPTTRVLPDRLVLLQARDREIDEGTHSRSRSDCVEVDDVDRDWQRLELGKDDLQRAALDLVRNLIRQKPCDAQTGDRRLDGHLDRVGRHSHGGMSRAAPACDGKRPLLLRRQRQIDGLHRVEIVGAAGGAVLRKVPR